MATLNTQAKRYISIHNTLKELENEKEILRKEIINKMKEADKKTFTVPTGVLTLSACWKRTLNTVKVFNEVNNLDKFLEIVKVNIKDVEKILSPDIIESCVSESVPVEKLLVFNT